MSQKMKIEKVQRKTLLKGLNLKEDGLIWLVYGLNDQATRSTFYRFFIQDEFVGYLRTYGKWVDIYLTPKFRNQGLGKKLLATFLEQSKRKNLSFLVHEKNSRALHFFERLMNDEPNSVRTNLPNEMTSRFDFTFKKIKPSSHLAS